MKNPKYYELARKASARNGVFTLNDVKALGLAPRTINDGISDGRFDAVEPGVYTVGGSQNTLRQRVTATVLSFPGLAAASHQTAAEMWGMTDRGIRKIEVVTTRWDRVRREGVAVHESKDLEAGDVTIRHGVPVTIPVRTVVDLGASAPFQVETALEQGIRLGLFRIEDVDAFVRRVGRRGRRGVGVIRPLLDARRVWDNVTESTLEDEFRKLVVHAGLPEPGLQHVVRDDSGSIVCRADFAYPEDQLLIELDSEAHHMDRMTFRNDRVKQNRATLLGWTVLRYTWWDIVDHGGRVVADLRGLLTGSRR